MPSGYIYYAHEVTANKDYYLNTSDVALTTGSSSTKPCDASSAGTPLGVNSAQKYYVADVKHPSLTIEKRVISQQDGKEVNIQSVPASTADFELYRVATADEIIDETVTKISLSDGTQLVRAKDADGKDIAMQATHGSNSTRFNTYTAQLLTSGGTYYLLETAVSSKTLVLPTTDGEVPSQQTYTKSSDGKIFYGPYTVEDNKCYAASFTAYDYYNYAEVKVKKYDSYTGECLNGDGSSLYGTGFSYVLAVQVPDTDTQLADWLTSCKWSTTCPVNDFTEKAASGTTWYYSAVSTAQVDADGRTIPNKDSSGNILDYWVIEITAPDGYNNKVNIDGTEGHNYAKASYDASTVTYTATLSDAPKTEIDLTKTLIDVWEQVSNLPAYYEKDVPFALYAVDKTTKKLTYLGTSKTNGLGETSFTAAYDLTKYDYIVVETDSQGYDYKNGKADTRVAAFDPATYDGKTLSELQAKETNMHLFTGTDELKYVAGDTAAQNRYVGTEKFYNYNPYIQLKFNKLGFDPEDPETTWPLAMAKFHAYKVPVTQYTSGHDADYCTDAYVDKANGTPYVYETDENGNFYTIAEDFYDQYVYIFKEIEAAPGYKLNEELVVVMPDDYYSSKNDVYSVPTFKNELMKGEGESFERYFRIALDKFSDRNANLTYDADKDLALADTTFETRLVDKDHKVVRWDNFETVFTTGTDEKDPSYALSETMKLTEADFTSMAAAGVDMDNVFTFYSNGSAITWAEFSAMTTHEKNEANISIRFTLRLEEVDYPELTTPIQLMYYTTITTGTSSGTTIDKTYTIQKHNDNTFDNPIMNVYGNKVFVQVRKLVDGSRWQPTKDGDYAEFVVVKASELSAYLSGATVESAKVIRINASNWNEQEITLLEPETEYVAFESHAPSGYDKPQNNYKAFKTGSLDTIRNTDPDIRIQKVDFTDTPYVTIELQKVGQDNAGKTIELVLSDGTGIYDPNYQYNTTDKFDSAIVIRGVTDSEGKITFTVPKYNYSTAYHFDGRNSGYPIASYKAVEFVNGKSVELFGVINSANNVVSAQNATNTLKVVNPITTDLTITKLGVAASEYPVKDVKFKVEYAAATAAVYTSATAPAAPTTGWTTVTEQILTDENGQIKLENLSSGWYRVTETIPNGYVYAGKTYTVTFVLVTPGDAANLVELNGSTGKYWESASVTVLSDKVEGIDVQTWNTVAADESGVGLTVKNTAMAHLTVKKVFVADDTVTVPSKVDVGAYDETAKLGEEGTITINGKTGEVELELVPGTYKVYELLAIGEDSSWISTWASKTVTATTEQTITTDVKVSGTYGLGTTGSITLTAADTEDAASCVTFTNYSARMELKAKKVDTDGNALAGAEFIVFYKSNNTAYYYKGQNATTGYGEYSTNEADAKRYTTDAQGLLDAVFYADMKTLGLESTGNMTGTFYIREIKAPAAQYNLIKDTDFQFSAGQVLDLTSDEAKNLVDHSGLTVDITLIGHTKENAAKHEDPTKVPGATFELYKKDKDGNITLVTSYDEDGNPVTGTVTDKDGEGSFVFLDELEEGESYILVQKTTTDGYWDTKTYYDTTMGVDTETIAIDGKTYPATTVFTYESQKEDPSVDITVYNMPKSSLLVLKYDYETPQTVIPEKATFKAEMTAAGIEGDDVADYHYDAILVQKDAAITEAIKAQAAEQGYDYIGGVFADTDKNYSYYVVQGARPGTYTVTETNGAEGYLYTPAAEETDPWYGVRTGVVVDDDGGLAIISYANVPNPESNKINIEKESTATHGTGENGTLGNLQDTLSDGSWQSIDYKISKFAPCVEADGTLPDYVEYPMKSLVLEDTGLVFKDNTTSGNTLTNVEGYLTRVTVGKANYENAVNTLTAAVFGVKADGTATLESIVNVANGAKTVTFAQSKKYVAFKVVYNADESGNAQNIAAHFYAEPITCTFVMKQDGSTVTELVGTVINTAKVTMGYDIGMTDDTTVSMSDDATVTVNPVVELPEGKLVKDVQIADGQRQHVDEMGTATFKGGDDVIYYLTFSNAEESGSDLVIAEPFIADILPECIDIDTAGDVSPFSVTAYRADGTEFDIQPGSVVYNKASRYVYVTSKGQLAAGEKMVLTIKGSVNTANALAEYSADGIWQTAYAGSETVLPKNKQNPEGAAFQVDGVPASEHTPIDALDDYCGVKYTIGHNLDSNTGITIIKEVAGEVTGADKYMSGKANVAITNSEGDVFYKVTVTSSSAVAAGGLRIADVLPNTNGDNNIKNVPRGSGFAVLNAKDFTVTVAGKKLSSSQYEVHFTTGIAAAEYNNALMSGDFSYFSQSTADDTTRGWIVQINTALEADATVVITFTAKAPAAVTKDEDGKVISTNLFEQAVNDATVYTVNEDDIFNSNLT